MKLKSWQISRRTLLRGAGAAIALPYLGVMERDAWAQPQLAKRPRFIGICALLDGYVGKFGHKADPAQNAVVAPWTPDETGANYTPNEFFLAPFFEKRVNSKLTIMTGFTDRSATHHSGICSFLGSRGTLCQWSSTAGCVNAPDLGWPSLDQQLARWYTERQEYTSMPSLVLGASKANYAYDHISWRTAKEPANLLINPKEVFDKLFGGAPSSVNIDAEKRRFYGKSVLDSVRGSALDLQKKLGTEDSKKLDLYLESIWELEKEIEALPDAVCNPGTLMVPDASKIPDYFKNVQGEGLSRRLPVMYSLMAKAVECDRTRVLTLQVQGTYGISSLPFLGFPSPLHYYSHWDQGTSAADIQNRKDAMNAHCQYQLKQLAEFMAKLDQIRESDGATALDNSIIYFSGDMGDGGRHTNTSMPVLLGGRGGRSESGAWRVNAGRHFRANKWTGSDPRWVPGLQTGVGHPIFEPSKGEQTVRDLLWGIVDACGLELKAADFGGAATSPISLATL